jgi:hypothetical protein
MDEYGAISHLLKSPETIAFIRNQQIRQRSTAQVSMNRAIVTPLLRAPVANKNCVWFDVISDRNGKLKVKSDVLEPGVP